MKARKIFLFCFLFLCCWLQAQTLIPADGLHIVTEAVKPNGKAKLVVTGKVANDAPGKMKATVEVLDAERRVIMKSKSVKPAAAFTLKLPVSNVQLWSPENPKLYTVVYTLFNGKQEVARKEEKFGFRFVNVTQERGFTVNGNDYKLRGVVWPQELPWLRNANRECKKALLKKLSEMGCNALSVRAADPTEDFCELCDETGMFLLVDVSQDGEGAVRESLGRLRNHPCIVLWSAGSQTFGGTEEEADRLMQTVRIIREADSTRPVTAGLTQVDMPLKKGLVEMLDIPGLDNSPFRYQEMYNKTQQHQLIAIRTYTYSEKERNLYQENPWVLGQFLQTNMVPLIAQTDTFYLYRSIWNKESHTLHIATHWNRAAGEHVIVPVYTDYPKAELLLNGKSLGKEDKHVWQVPYEAGELTAVAYNGKGKEMQRTVLHTAAEPVHIQILPFYAGNLTFVTLRISDQTNNLCSDARSQLNIDLNGTGKLWGCMLGNAMRYSDGNTLSIQPETGVCIVVIEGNGVLTVKSDGLIGGQLQINHNR